MKFKIDKAWYWGLEQELEINSLEELIKFIEEHGSIMINKTEIMICDYYAE